MAGKRLTREEYARLIEVWIGERTLELLEKRDRMLSRWDTYHRCHCNCNPEIGHAADLTSCDWDSAMQEENDDSTAYAIFGEEKERRGL